MKWSVFVTNVPYSLRPNGMATPISIPNLISAEAAGRIAIAKGRFIAIERMVMTELYSKRSAMKEDGDDLEPSALPSNRQFS